MSEADQARVGPTAEEPSLSPEEEGEGGGKEPATEAAPGPSAAFRLMVTRREPAVKLQYAVSGLEPLAWSEDHRVSVSTARSIAVLELICDVHNPGQDLVIHRTSVPAPLNSCLLKVSHLHGSTSGPPPAVLPRTLHRSLGKPGLHLALRFPAHPTLRNQETNIAIASKKPCKLLRSSQAPPTNTRWCLPAPPARFRHPLHLSRWAASAGCDCPGVF